MICPDEIEYAFGVKTVKPSCIPVIAVLQIGLSVNVTVNGASHDALAEGVTEGGGGAIMLKAPETT